jgi:hypothetical protein
MANRANAKFIVGGAQVQQLNAVRHASTPQVVLKGSANSLSVSSQCLTEHARPVVLLGASLTDTRVSTCSVVVACLTQLVSVSGCPYISE